jgi:hypothetical protein
VSDDRDDTAHGSRPPAAAGIPDEALLEINRLWTIVRAFSNVAHDNPTNASGDRERRRWGVRVEPPLRRRVERSGPSRARGCHRPTPVISRAEQRLPQAVEVRPLVEVAAALRLASANHRRVILTVERKSAEPCRRSIARALQALLICCSQRRSGRRPSERRSQERGRGMPPSSGSLRRPARRYGATTGNWPGPASSPAARNMGRRRRRRHARQRDRRGVTSAARFSCGCQRRNGVEKPFANTPGV